MHRLIIVLPAHRQARPIVQSDDDDDVTLSTAREYSKPAQDAVAKRIAAMEAELNALYQKRDLCVDDMSLARQIKQLRGDLEKEKQALKSKQKNAQRQKKLREKRKEAGNRLREEHPEAAKLLKLRNGVGQPRLEDDQDDLLATLADIAMHGASAADRRRSETVRSCKTLKELNTELIKMGFKISESATYLRLLPRNSTTREGKLHVVTVPVKLCRAQSDHHRDHQDQYFCKSSMDALDEVASVLGPEQVPLPHSVKNKVNDIFYVKITSVSLFLKSGCRNFSRRQSKSLDWSRSCEAPSSISYAYELPSKIARS